MVELERQGVTTFKMDVSDIDSVIKGKQFMMRETDGYLDVLFNNAGQSCTFPAIDVTDEQFRQCFEVNVFGPIRLTRELAPLLINAKGTVGFTGSVSGLIPFPFSSIYSSTKSVFHQFAAVLRLELKPFDVKVINIVTGGVKTAIQDIRPLPESSIYNVPGIHESLEERRAMAVKNKPMEPDVYAKKVVNDFEHATCDGRLNIYRGHMSTFLGYLLCWCPRFIVERALIRKFRFVGIFNFLKEKYSKEKIE